MIVFVKIKQDEEPVEVEVDDDATIGLLCAVVSSIANHSPDKITITVDGNIIPPETVISTLDLGKILFFTAVLENESEAAASDHILEQMFNAEEQQRILQQIQRQRIQDNYEYAYQNNPEDFVTYSLLFIDCKINNVAVQAMIDTGAQISVMPLSIAKECNVDYLVDPRFASMCVGVGAQVTKGRIHSLKVQIDDLFWATPFTVIEGQLDHCILGIDWMTKNKAVVDVGNKCLIIGNKKIPFVKRQSRQK